MDAFVLYFHSHGANRQEGRFLLNFAAIKSFNLCLLDARACGQSGGKFSTLGAKEASDVYSLVKELQRRFGLRKMVLYGRSMGAAAVLKFVSEHRRGGLIRRESAEGRGGGARLTILLCAAVLRQLRARQVS